MTKATTQRVKFFFWLFVLYGFAGLAYLAYTHYVSVTVYTTPLAILFGIMFVNLTISFVGSMLHRGWIDDPLRAGYLDSLTVAVVIPVYNEDTELLAAGLRSLKDQTRKPNEVWIVDDGSTNLPLKSREVRNAIERHLRPAGIKVYTHRQVNSGKRHAQAYAFAKSGADIYVTIDSDTVLDASAVQNILIPFQSDKTMSVAGIVYGQNHKKSLLTRIIELGFSTSFMSGRAAEGYFEAVRVNCGILAAYRGGVIRDNLGRYLGQTFFGEPATFGDDRALTILARERGACLYQPTAIAYSALPEKISHLVRQRLRWAKSWFWGTRWLLSRPLKFAEFWITFFQIASMMSYYIAVGLIIYLAATGAVSYHIITTTILVSAAIGMFSNLRYVIWGRSDVSAGDRLLTWLVSPLSSIIYMLVLTPLYIIAIFSLRKNQWGTRQKGVEVGIYAN